MDPVRADVDAVDGQPQSSSTLPLESFFFLLLVRDQVWADEGDVFTAEYQGMVGGSAAGRCGACGLEVTGGAGAMAPLAGEQPLKKRLDEVNGTVRHVDLHSQVGHAPGSFAATAGVSVVQVPGSLGLSDRRVLIAAARSYGGTWR